MLAYLEALCLALKARDSLAIGELLRHPLASALPTVVLQEAQCIAVLTSAASVAPIHALRLYHQTAHLLGACTDPASRVRAVAATRTPGERTRQIELELPIRSAVA